MDGEDGSLFFGVVLEYCVERLGLWLRFGKVEMIAQREAVALLAGAVPSTRRLIGLEVVQAEGIHGEQSVVAGVPGGGRAEIARMKRSPSGSFGSSGVVVAMLTPGLSGS